MGIREKLIQAMSLNIVLWMAMLTVFAGLMFCAAGIYIGLAGALNPVAAALIVGLGLIAIVALAVTGLMLSTRKQKRINDSNTLRENPDNILEHQLRPMIGDKATDWAKQNTALVIVGALSAGVILSASPRLRRISGRAIMPMLTRKAIRAFQDFSDNE